MRRVYVGFTARPIAGADVLMPEPQAPSNWKDVAKIAAYVAEAKVKAVADLVNQQMFAEPDKVAMIDMVDPNRPTLFDADAGVGTAVDYLAELDTADQIIGHRIFYFLDLAVARRIRLNGSLMQPAFWAVLGHLSKVPYLDSGNPMRRLIIDPTEILGGTEGRDDPDTLMRVWNFDEARTFATWKSENPAALRALNLARFAQFLGEKILG